MHLGSLKPDRAFLSNKVAQQLFLMFILCAMVPLAAMTAISYFRVNRQLNRVADERLRDACKSAGMNLVERLSFLESDLDSLMAVNPKGSAGKLWPASPEMRARLSQRYRWISLRSVSGPLIARFGAEPETLEFTPEEIQHLSGGNTLVTTRENREKIRAVYIARIYKLEDGTGAVILGEIDPGYLWESNSLVYSAAEIFVVDGAMRILHSTLQDQSPLRELETALKKGSNSGRIEWGPGKDGFIAHFWTIFMRPSFYDTWIVVYCERRETVLESMGGFEPATFGLIALLMFWVAAFLSLFFIRRRMKPVEQLCEETRRITAKDFGARVSISNKDEFGELGAAFNNMAQSLEGYFEAIQTINKIGISLSEEEDETKLLETILKGAKTLINADGATLYLVSENLEPTLGLMQIDSLGIVNQRDVFVGGGESDGFSIAMEAISLLGSRTVCCPDIYAADGERFRFQKEFDEKTGYRTHSLLSVPLTDHEGEGIGVLQLINARDRQDGSIISFSEEDVRLAESLASQAAVALSKNHLMTELILLFEGLTELVATAVDAKSPHTADHCKRVPALTMMIAEAACRAREGPFKNFSLSPDERYELKIAALLHDCGKVATPVHIVDKATKLDGIQDRIDLIDTRFEILSRDKLIELYRNRLDALLGDGADAESAAVEKKWNELSAHLHRDLKFLRECNAGRELITAAAKKRILDIARNYSWINRERERKPVLTMDEAENLMIVEGTLTERERAIVNEHVNLTVRMLQSLPLPKKLRNLPVHAGGHHERMDGSGYPQGLKREQITIQSRMISLADVFEALTAADRPYKRASNVSEAMEILRDMKQNGQIDPDLFDLFVRENLHLLYASHFLNPSQSADPVTIPAK